MTTMNSSLAAEYAKLQSTSAHIELYTLDCSSIGGATYRFTNYAAADGGGITYKTITYQPYPVVVTGFDSNSSGALARPTITLANVDRVLLSAIIGLGDMVGAKFKRLLTKEMFLDSKPQANPSAYTESMFVLEEMTYLDRNGVSFTLANPLDNQYAKYPGRQILKDPSVNNLYAPGVSRTRIR